jgi:FkbM family methyltransferase
MGRLKSARRSTNELSRTANQMLKKAFKRLYNELPFKRRMFEPLRHRLPQSVYRHLHFTGPFYVSIDRGRGFVIEHPGTIVENELFWAGVGESWEAFSNRLWTALCDGQSGTIVDVGANSGVYSLIASAVASPEATVVAFEPVERIAALLRRNVALNGDRIEVEAVALSNQDGTAMIHDFDEELAYSASLEHPFPGATRSYPVTTLRLDTFLESRPVQALSACKIDVEGHEPSVIEGMARALERSSPPMLVEILDSNAAARVERMIEGRGYDRWGIDEQSGLVPIQSLRPMGGENWNALLCRAEDFEARGLRRFLADGQEQARAAFRGNAR